MTSGLNGQPFSVFWLQKSPPKRALREQSMKNYGPAGISVSRSGSI